jgi:hypothetical protein
MANTKLTHDHCECELQIHGPHIGLYCKPHNHWLKWLTKEELKIAVDSGVKLKTIPARDKLALKDNHTIDKRLKRQKRWHKYKANTGSLKKRGVKTAPTRML